MENRRNHFLDGLVIGAALGSAAVFLFGTKKGRQVFGMLKEEGLSRFGKLEDLFYEYKDAMSDEVEDEIDGVKEKIAAKEEKPKKLLHRKLFKGLSKKK